MLWLYGDFTVDFAFHCWCYVHLAWECSMAGMCMEEE